MYHTDEKSLIQFKQDYSHVGTLVDIVLYAYNIVNPLYGYNRMVYPGFYINYVKRFIDKYWNIPPTISYSVEDAVRESFLPHQLELRYITEQHIKEIAQLILTHLSQIETKH